MVVSKLVIRQSNPDTSYQRYVHFVKALELESILPIPVAVRR
jgi:hypothetical protein